MLAKKYFFPLISVSLLCTTMLTFSGFWYDVRKATATRLCGKQKVNAQSDKEVGLQVKNILEKTPRRSKCETITQIFANASTAFSAGIDIF